MNSTRTESTHIYQHRVEGGLVDNRVEGSLREIHSLDIHEQIFKILALVLVLLLHGLDADVGYIDIGNGPVPLVEHLLAEPGIARTHVEYFVGLIHMSGNDVLEPTVSLVPVEGLGIPASPQILLGVSVVPVIVLPVLTHHEVIV